MHGQIQVNGRVEDAISDYLNEGTEQSGHLDCSTIVRGGSGEMRFVSLRIPQCRRKPEHPVSLGDDLILEAVIETRKPLKAPIISVQISTPDGLNLVNAVDADSGFSYVGTEGKGTVRVHFPDIRFYPGSCLLYFLDWNERGQRHPRRRFPESIASALTWSMAAN